jgi:3-dehydroquinate synthase II
MRKIWVQIDAWDQEIVTTALEGGAEGLVLPPGLSEKAKALGKIMTVAEDGDLKPEEDVVFFTVTDGKEEEEILRLSRSRKVILQCADWTIIPLENLIAKGADVIARVEDFEEAQTAFGILEKGVRHILCHPKAAGELKKILSLLITVEEETDLTTAVIETVHPVGMGDRVCVDTCSAMRTGEGILVGNSSGALFLVHAETVANPYVAPRPFRVNAGAVHAYTRVPGGKTRYLSELSAGDAVLTVDYRGRTTAATIGRLKIERRPLMLVNATAGGKRISTIVQNAETIRLTGPDGKPISVVRLTEGDKVLVALEASGRHFGIKIDETITEK